MSEQTPNLALPFIMPAQAQKHVTHNESIELLDVIVQLTLEAVDAAAPIPSPSEGQAWAISAMPTGDWAGQEGKIAAWHGGGWLFVTPKEGWMAWVKGDAELQVYTGSNWAVLAGIAP